MYIVYVSYTSRFSVDSIALSLYVYRSIAVDMYPRVFLSEVKA